MTDQEIHDQFCTDGVLDNCPDMHNDCPCWDVKTCLSGNDCPICSKEKK